MEMRYLGFSSEFDRPRLQALRANPPGLAGKGPRKRVFGAALDQWDALLGASGSVVPAAMPILVFYALSQATRAVCAARIEDQQWNPTGHGLSVKHAGGTLGETIVVPEGGPVASFALFCRALGTDGLTGATTLDALWAANPQTESVTGLGEEAHPVLELSCIGSGDLYVSASIGGEFAQDLPVDPNDATDAVASRLVHAYPRAVGLRVDQVRPNYAGVQEAVLSWPGPNGKKRPINEVAPGLTSHPNSGAYLQPSLNKAGDVLAPLPLWWATLLTLSSIARYSPDRWMAALARDRSVCAVPIEEALKNAHELLPHMLLAALEHSGPATG